MSGRIELPEDGVLVEDDQSRSRFLRNPAMRWLTGLLVFLLGAVVFIALTSMARVPELAPLSRVATLPHSHKLDPHHVDNRLILIGDVHGMYDELQKLLHKVDYDDKKDTLVFLGDMITKGYDSLGVVDFAIKKRAYCVRGNHEDEILSLYASRHHIDAPKTFPPHASPTMQLAGETPVATLAATYGPELDTKAQPTGSFEALDKERDGPLVKALKKRHIRYLQACPAILDLGQVSKRGIEAVAVHGGLLWNEHDLENQDIKDVLRIRSIVPPDFTHGSEDPDDGEPWFDKWNDEQLTRKKSERFEVFYGHDASKGLQLRRYSKGLDTRCQRGGKLSAYVVKVQHDGRYNEELVQVKCK